jgi:STE24 endopeptidase
VPIGLILVCHDIGATLLELVMPNGGAPAWAEPLMSLAAAAVVFVFAPLLLRRVLRTRPLDPSPLRERLEAMCRQAGLRYREILLWHTDHHVGNAAVMGVLPQVRYILLSDLLLETMSDEQIEAVFAHELGHVVHKHLTWSGLFVVVLLLAAIGPGQWVDQFSSNHLPSWLSDIVVPVLATAGGMLLLLGGLSRFFERQADVYAARMIEEHHRPDSARERPLAVGSYGANLFASALHRVAVINGIPIHARNLSHGSIAGRIDYLHRLSGDPARTNAFDRFMTWIYVGVVGLLVMFGGWVVVILVR